MNCTIDWNTLNVADWEERLAGIRRLPVLQALPYARAVRSSKQMSARWGLIRIDGAEAGLLQIQEVGLLGPAIHLLTLDRGPVWFDGAGSLDHWREFLETFNGAFPRRIGRRRRFMPELAETDATRKMLADAGFRRNSALPGYQTIWLDITPDPERLRAGLKQKWRNTLNKSERQGLTVEIDDGTSRLDWLTKRYAEDKKARDYPGPKPAFLLSVGRAFATDGKLIILAAMKDGTPQAGAMLLLHGGSATYQTGWAGAEGRKLGASSLLLWHAVTELKARGIRDFDLGGINDRDAAGVKAFKAGLGGTEVRLVGQYG